MLQQSEKTRTQTVTILRSFTCAAVLLFVVACDSDKAGSSDGRKSTAIQRDQITRIDRWAVESPIRSSVESAVIRQCILFEYHFEEGSSRLTLVGRRDIEILARHYRGEDWVLSVRQGDASHDLYNARIEVVKKRMGPLGVQAEQLTIVDAMPGGAGLASTDVRRIHKESLEGAESLGSGGELAPGEVFVSPIDAPLEGGS